MGNAGLAYRQPPKVATVCFMQYMTSYFASKEYLRLPQKYALNYLRSNQHFQMELISVNLLWNTYLRRMAMEVEWGEWIALWGLINMLQIPVAIVLSLGETGLKVIYPADCQNEVQATEDIALLGHEAELHYHSLERMASQNPQLAIAEELKQKYGHGKITEEICPKCGRKFQ